RQVGHQANVRTFRRFNRAEAAVVGLVNVAHFETGAFAAKSTRAHGVEAALVHHFVEWVNLAHELRQLRGGKEFANRSYDRADVDQLARGNGGGVVNRHAVFNDALHAGQT